MVRSAQVHGAATLLCTKCARSNSGAARGDAGVPDGGGQPDAGDVRADTGGHTQSGASTNLRRPGGIERQGKAGLQCAEALLRLGMAGQRLM